MSYQCNCGKTFAEPLERTAHSASCPATRIAKIRERLAAATPGPWEIPKKISMAIQVNGDTVAVTGGNSSIELIQHQQNAKLIANAPSDIAFLLDRLTRCERQVEIAKAFIIRIDEKKTYPGSDAEQICREALKALEDSK
jgi:hypothetical protein